MDAASLLLVEDDPIFARVLCRSLQQRDYHVEHAECLETANSLIESTQFHYAILDLNLGKVTSLELIPRLIKNNEDIKILILTGYASIATAVEAIKLGATNYLAKPADMDEILSALLGQSDSFASRDTIHEPMSVRRLEWEHIQKVLKENDGNISETARQLKMHRRTLQRKLQKRPATK